jgi:hypothetical protein
LQYPFKSEDVEALQGVKTDKRFKTYTGYDHISLLRKWLSDRTTTCNEFVGRCVAAMGYAGTQNIGRFDIADQLNARGLDHLWVPADSGSIPEFGDVYRLYDSVPDDNGMRLNHMAISLYVNGTDWLTVDAGQGGPSKGYDSIRRKKRTWKPSALRGWVSMKALLHSEKPLPYWAGGWWKVQEGTQDPYFYYFSASGKVSFTPTAPTSIMTPPVNPSMVGNFVVKGMFDVEISWQSADVDEKLQITSQDSKKRNYVLDGKTALGTKLKAKRLMMNNAFD